MWCVRGHRIEATWNQSVTVCDKTWKQTLHVVFGIHFRLFVDEVQPTMPVTVENSAFTFAIL